MLSDGEWLTLRASTLLRALSDPELEALVEVGAVRRLARSEELFTQGQKAQLIYIVLEGQIKLVRFGHDGGEAVFQVVRAGESCAEAAMLLNERYPLTAIAVTPVKVLAITASALRSRMTKQPEIAFDMLTAMSRHLQALVDQIEIIKLFSSDERVMRFLLDMCKTEHGPVRLMLPHEKTLIANRLGIQPETLSRALSRLKPLGIEVNGTMIEIDDVARLKKRLERTGV